VNKLTTNSKGFAVDCIKIFVGSTKTLQFLAVMFELILYMFHHLSADTKNSRKVKPLFVDSFNINVCGSANCVRTVAAQVTVCSVPCNQLRFSVFCEVTAEWTAVPLTVITVLSELVCAVPCAALSLFF
jgi:hypothetical protein